MNKKVIIGIVIVAVIAIVAYSFLQPKAPASSTDQNTTAAEEADYNSLITQEDVFTPEETAAHNTQLQQSDPVRFEALQKSDVGLCQNEKDPSEVDWCKAAVAEKLKDQDVCPSLAVENARNQCYNDVARAKQTLNYAKK